MTQSLRPMGGPCSRWLPRRVPCMQMRSAPGRSVGRRNAAGLFSRSDESFMPQPLSLPSQIQHSAAHSRRLQELAHALLVIFACGRAIASIRTLLVSTARQRVAHLPPGSFHRFSCVIRLYTNGRPDSSTRRIQLSAATATITFLNCSDERPTVLCRSCTVLNASSNFCSKPSSPVLVPPALELRKLHESRAVGVDFGKDLFDRGLYVAVHPGASCITCASQVSVTHVHRLGTSPCPSAGRSVDVVRSAVVLPLHPTSGQAIARTGCSSPASSRAPRSL